MAIKVMLLLTRLLADVIIFIHQYQPGIEQVQACTH